jgi:hypothetical protein
MFSVDNVIVATLAEFKALNIRPNMVVSKGRTSINDGWGGDFYWYPGDTTTADDNQVIQPTRGEAGRYRRLPLNGPSLSIDGVTPSVSVNFVTAYPGKSAMYVKPTAASATLPEIAHYIEFHSTVGYANRATAYKIGLGGLTIDDSVAAGNSADLYGINFVVHGYGGTGGNLLVGCEIDVNNLGAHATSLGDPSGVYGYAVAIGGTYKGTAAFWSAGIPGAGWQYAFAASGAVAFSGFYDTSNSPIVLCGVGTHTTGVDFTSATLTTAFASTGFAVTGTGNISALSATAIPAGGTAGAGYKFSSTANFGIFFGSGAPTLSAAKGSLYLRSDGSSTSTRSYINTDGSTAWTSITTAT